MSTSANGPETRGPKTFGEAFQRILRESTSTTDQGQRFERLVIDLVCAEPEFDVQDVWTWQEWPERRTLLDRDAQDLGIDLVAHLKSGQRVAIQCKGYRESTKVNKPDIQSFITDSARDCFHLRWMVTTSDWSAAAEKVIQRQGIPVSRIDFRSYAHRPYTARSGTQSPKSDPRRLYRLQEYAVNDVIDGLESQGHNRGKLIMACGTGKTFVALRVAEGMVPDNGRILFAAPSISLVSQARREWLTHTQRKMASMVVCSDQTAGGRDALPRTERVTPDSLVCPVESDPRAIAAHLAKPDGVKVVFCTYHSLRQVIEAQAEHRAPTFHLAIADEAHRTTGVDNRIKKVNFRLFHQGQDLRVAKRLYMTATPRIYSATSKALHLKHGIEVKDMSDLDVYGPQLHHLRFKQAVSANMLSDYRVIVLGVREADLGDGLRRRLEEAQKRDKPLTVKESDAARLMGTFLAMNGYLEGDPSAIPETLERVIAYASTIRRSEWFADVFNDQSLQDQFLEWARNMDRPLPNRKHLRAKHLDANHNAAERFHWLRQLNEVRDNDQALILSNVRIFSEGVDVPALDAVAFLDPRNSQIDIVQAVGRVMRKADGKRFGYIIVPVYMEEDVKDVVSELKKRKDAYKSIGIVLEALRSHDERLAESHADFFLVDESDSGESNGDETKPSPDSPPDQASWNLGTEGLFAQVAMASGIGASGHSTALTIENSVRQAAQYIAKSSDALEGVREALEIPSTDDLETSTVAALVLFNACLMHKQLKEGGHGMDDLVGVDEVGRARRPVGRLLEPWRAILDQDFQPIFRPALSILETVPNSAHDAVGRGIAILAECAVNLEESLTDLGYDHAGPLYHRILSSASSDGAYYTNHISALMLAGLTLSDDFLDWSDAEAVQRIKVLDPACGTGTLLVAALHTMKNKGLAHGAFTEAELPEIHRELVHHSIRGLDINYQATQLAAANLALGEPSVDYEKVHIHTMQHGPGSDGAVKLGSLELLVDSVEGQQPDLMANMKRAPVAGLAHEEGCENDDIRDVDVVIMNPPFTKVQERYRHFSQATVERMLEREATIKTQVNASDPRAGELMTSNSIATFFTPLVEAILHPVRGRFGSVIPTTACIGTAGLSERKFLADRFHLEYVVTTHDPQQMSFSAGTNIHETLLVRSRRNPENWNSPTKFVSLRRVPRNREEVDQWLSELASGGDSRWHRTTEWPREKVESGDWSPVQYLDGRLAQIPADLAASHGLAPADELATFGGNDSIRKSNLVPVEGDTDSGQVYYAAVMTHKTDDRRTMAAESELQLAPVPGREAFVANSLWTKASSLLFPQRLDTNNVRTPSILVDEPVFAHPFASVTPRESLECEPASISKAWCAFMNSTCGALFLLGLRSRKLTYPQFNLTQLRSIPLPDPRRCDITPLVRAFDDLCQQELLPWPQMHIDPVRRQIDDAVCEVLSLDPDEVADWRRRIVAEPTVSNQPAP